MPPCRDGLGGCASRAEQRPPTGTRLALLPFPHLFSSFPWSPSSRFSPFNKTDSHSLSPTISRSFQSFLSLSTIQQRPVNNQPSCLSRADALFAQQTLRRAALVNRQTALGSRANAASICHQRLLFPLDNTLDVSPIWQTRPPKEDHAIEPSPCHFHFGTIGFAYSIRPGLQHSLVC